MAFHAKIEAVNQVLLDGEPGNISTDEHSGYTGYRPQAVIDAMNSVLWGEWGFSEIGSEIVPGDKGALAVSQVQVWLKDLEFKPTSWGQNRVTRGDIGDARKGAQTDAIKKALSYFSIGNRAYQGLLKEDAKPATKKAVTGAPTTRSQTQQAGNGHVPQSSMSVEQKAPGDALAGKDKAVSLYNHAYKLGIFTNYQQWQELKADKLGHMVPDEKVTQVQYDVLVAELAKRKEAAVTSGK